MAAVVAITAVVATTALCLQHPSVYPQGRVLPHALGTPVLDQSHWLRLALSLFLFSAPACLRAFREPRDPASCYDTSFALLLTRLQLPIHAVFFLHFHLRAPLNYQLQMLRVFRMRCYSVRLRCLCHRSLLLLTGHMAS